VDVKARIDWIEAGLVERDLAARLQRGAGSHVGDAHLARPGARAIACRERIDIAAVGLHEVGLVDASSCRLVVEKLVADAADGGAGEKSVKPPKLR
jgi:hypothetical protein